jgi:tetratricopeptide (TPR) repeat protein
MEYKSASCYSESIKILHEIYETCLKSNDNEYNEYKIISGLLTGDCYYDLHYYGKAVYYYGISFKAMEGQIRHSAYASFRNYGAAMLQIGDYSGGLQMLKHLFDFFHPQYNFPGMYYQYGKALILNGHTKEGIKWLKSEIDGDDIGATIRMNGRYNDIEQSDDKILIHRNYLYLAKGFHQEGQNRQAEDYYGQVFQILEDCNDNVLINKAFALNEIAYFYMDKGFIDEAYKLNNEALDLVKKVLENMTDPIVGHILKLHGMLIAMQGDYIQAQDYYNQAYDIFKDFLGEDAPYTKSVYEMIDN